MGRTIRILTAGVVACALTACAPAPPGESSSEEPFATSNVRVEPKQSGPTSEAPPPPTTLPEVTSCPDMAAELPLEAQVGQLYMVGVQTSGLDAATASAITQTSVGSVVLLGNTDAGVAKIADLTADVRALGESDLPIMVAADQEGGTIQRLRGEGFSDIPSALEQAKLPGGKLEEAAYGWGLELGAAGVVYDLAPVADVVPASKQSSNAPIGALQRNYGNDVKTTSRAVGEFVAGMTRAGIATSLKHFPGLGQVDKNTDFDVAHDTHIVPGDADWASFMAGIDAGAGSVMVSTAIFEKLDPDNQAVFSHKIITGMLRGELGFDKVVISDDLGAAAAVKDIPPAERGVRFIAAGGDIVIDADPAILGEMVAATVKRAESDPDFAARVEASTARVLELKRWSGLVSCG